MTMIVYLLECKVSADTVRQHIQQRDKGVSGTGHAVLEHQLEHWQSLTDDERIFSVSVTMEWPQQIDADMRALDMLVSRRTEQ